MWLADITYVWTREGWLYLACVLDAYSRKIVGWSMSERMTKDLVLDALRMALGRRRPDRGRRPAAPFGSRQPVRQRRVSGSYCARRTSRAA